LCLHIGNGTELAQELQPFQDQDFLLLKLPEERLNRFEFADRNRENLSSTAFFPVSNYGVLRTRL
jgi:hypothetical protein